MVEGLEGFVPGVATNGLASTAAAARATAICSNGLCNACTVTWV